MSGYVLKVPPAEEPVTLDEAKVHLRVDTNADDDYISGLIAVAREQVEVDTGRAMIKRTYQLILDNFPNAFGYGTVMGSPGFGQGYAGWIPGYARGANVNIWFANGIVSLPFPKLRKINSIKYIDRSNIEQTLDPATYQVDTASEPGRIAPKPTQIWPFTQLSLLAPALAAITIEFEAGYGETANEVPAGMKHMMKLLIGSWYVNRENIIAVRGSASAVEVPGYEALKWANKFWTAV